MQLNLFNIDQLVKINYLNYKELVYSKLQKEEIEIDQLILLNKLIGKTINVESFHSEYKCNYFHQEFDDFYQLEEYYVEEHTDIDEYYIDTVIVLKVRVPLIEDIVKVKVEFKHALIDDIVSLNEIIEYCIEDDLLEFYDKTKTFCIEIDEEEEEIDLIFKVKKITI